MLETVWSAAIVIGCSWATVCNWRTHRQRRRLIRVLFSDPNWRALHVAFDDVRYDRHMLALLTFRDPKALYGQALAHMW